MTTTYDNNYSIGHKSELKSYTSAAAGLTDKAISMDEELNTILVNVCSMIVYRHMDWIVVV